jgi:hypothetical protein
VWDSDADREWRGRRTDVKRAAIAMARRGAHD